MFDKKIIDDFKSGLEKAKSILILLPPEPENSLVTAGLNFYQALKEGNKNIQIGCSKLENRGPIKSSIGNQNLILSFKYSEKDLDKVDYDVDEEGNFQLLIKPKAGSPPPDSEKIKFTYSGAKADLVIVLGINSLEELGKLYSDEKTFLDQATIFSLNKNSNPANFATYSLHTDSVSSIIEIVAYLLFQCKIQVSTNTANELLRGIYLATNNLNSSKLTADTFETIAFLIKKGAKPIRTLPQRPSMVAPVFEKPNSFRQIPPARVPSDWRKPKIFRSTTN